MQELQSDRPTELKRSGLSQAALREALQASHDRAAELEVEIAAKVEEMKAARDEADLLKQLLLIRKGGASDERPAKKASAGKESVHTTRHGARSHPVVGEAIKELAATGHPLHISELMERLKARDVRIPGAGKQANLIAHLTRADDVVRPSRGIYGLASWDLPKPPVRRAKRRRVRGQSKADAKS